MLIMVRYFGVDVAVYQPTSMSNYISHGAKFVIAKLSEGLSYFNPKAHAQVKSTHANHAYLHAYHFATFSNSVSRAKKEAKFFVHRAEIEGISKKRYLWLDWEVGDGNVVTRSVPSNTAAIIAFMDVCHNAGYKVGLYSGASVLRNNIDTKKVIKRFGNCLWVASYATMGRIDTPDFNYFPSMEGVAIWQFTDNWRGLNVDGNISLIDLHSEKKTNQPTNPKPITKPKEKIPKIVFFPIINNNPNYKVRLLDSNGHYQDKYIPTNSNWKVWDVKTIKNVKYYKIGTDKQWVPAKFCKV